MWAKLKQSFNEGRCREDLRQFFWFGVGYAIVLILGYLLLRQINLSLSVEEMGRFSYVMSLVGLIAAVFYQAPALAYLRFHDNHELSVDLRKKLLPIFVFAFILVAALVWWKTHAWPAMLIAFIALFFERTHILRAQMRVGAVNILKIAEIAVPLLALVFYNSYLREDGAPQATLVLALYGLGYATCLFFPLRLKACESPSGGVLAKYLVPVLFTTLVAALIENLTVVATKSYLGYEAAAQMGVAARNLIFIRALFQFFQMFYPVIYFREMKLGHYRTVHFYRGAIVICAVLFVTLLTVFSPFLYTVTGAEAYVGSSRVFVILAIAALLDFLFETFSLFFQYEIKTWKATIVKVVFLAVLSGGILFVRSHTLSSLVYSVLAASLSSSLPGLLLALWQERRFEARQHPL